MSRVFTVLFLMSLIQRTSPDDQQIIRRRGTNVTLTFQVPTGSTSVWLKRLNNEKYISYCRDGRPTRPSDQEESFKGRVEGMDCRRIDGTISVTVRNLTRSDSGTYEFHRVEHDGRRFNETIFLIVTDPDQQIIRRRGTNVTLTFQVPTGSTSVWLKRLNNEKYISYCQDGRSTRPSDQEESFKGRVEGMDCGRIDGTISVTVRNLTRSDNGTYEFHRVEHDGRHFNETIFLIVTDPVETFTFPTLEMVHICWVGIVVCTVIGIIYGRQCRKPKSSRSNPQSVKLPHEEDDGDAAGLVSEKKSPFDEV